MRIIIPIEPRTKKNSQQIVKFKNKYIIIPSKVYKNYEKECAKYMPIYRQPKPYINKPVNVKCLYYMSTKRKVDLNNLLEATTDILTHYGILEDDNYKIVHSHDGSRVFYDKDNPRTEIYIDYINENQKD